MRERGVPMLADAQRQVRGREFIAWLLVANLLRKRRFCSHAYRVAVWCSRHNYLTASGGVRGSWS